MPYLYSIIYASLMTLLFVAAAAYAIGRAHEARNRVEAFRLGWRAATEHFEERDLRRRLAQARGNGFPGEIVQPSGRYHPRSPMPINERRPSPRRRRVTIEEAETMDLAGRR